MRPQPVSSSLTEPNHRLPPLPIRLCRVPAGERQPPGKRPEVDSDSAHQAVWRRPPGRRRRVDVVKNPGVAQAAPCAAAQTVQQAAQSHRRSASPAMDVIVIFSSGHLRYCNKNLLFDPKIIILKIDTSKTADRTTETQNVFLSNLLLKILKLWSFSFQQYTDIQKSFIFLTRQRYSTQTQLFHFSRPTIDALWPLTNQQTTFFSTV